MPAVGSLTPGVPGPSSRPEQEPSGQEPAGQQLDDPARLAAVRRVARAWEQSPGLDRLTRLAARLLDAPVAHVTLVGERQEIVSVFGVALSEQERSSSLDGSLCSVTVETGSELPVPDLSGGGHPDLPTALRGVAQAYLGVPLTGTDGHRLGALCVFGAQPRQWSEQEVALLRELAESVAAELELHALSVEARSTATRLELALDAADIGSFDLDVGSGRLVWDDRLVRLFGYDRETFVEQLSSFDDRVHPQDLERVRESVDAAVRTAGDFSTEYRIVLPDGRVRWVEARGRVLTLGGRDHLLGVAYDSTALRDARDRLARLLETMTDAFYSLAPDWRFTYVNRQAERLLRRPRQELLGVSLWEAFPGVLGTEFEEHYRRAAESGEPVSFEAAYAPLAGWYDVTAWPGPDGLSVYFREVTARRESELEREQALRERELAYAEAQAATQRLALLAEASDRLSASLEPRQVLERLSGLVVPGLGDWVGVALVAETASSLLGEDLPDPSRVHVVHVAHADAGQQDVLERLAASLPLSTRDPVGVGAVVRTGRPEWLPEPVPGAVEALTEDPEDRARLHGLGTDRALTLPLANRGRVLGAMTVAQPPGAEVDRVLLADLAARAAVALDNALLYGAERRTGITLQCSLLPRDVPQVPGLLTAARYLPGATGAFVGGDWYQGVRVGRGLVLAMGDVMGHGMRSAARMGQLRAIVATLALEGHGPGRLLTRLAESVDVLLDLELATLLVAAYDPDAATLTISSAGHPPPLVAPLGGEPEFVSVEPGPPLGSFATVYDEVVVPLQPDTTIVLYTDGLVENRTEPLDVGLERLRDALRGLRLPPDEVADRVLQETARRGGGDDDVALLVLSHLPTG